MSSDQVDADRRKMLVAATAGSFVVGGGFVAYAFGGSLAPSERAKAAGAPVEVDLSKIEMGQRISVMYRGKPVWVMRRTPEAIENIKKLSSSVLDSMSKGSSQPSYCSNETRSVEGKEEFFITISLCTHLGCIPSYVPEVGAQDYDVNWLGGLYCPCHGSRYDLAGRVFPNVPAPTNLVIPNYAYLSDTKVVIGLGPDEIETNGEA